MIITIMGYRVVSDRYGKRRGLCGARLRDVKTSTVSACRYVITRTDALKRAECRVSRCHLSENEVGKKRQDLLY